MRYIGNVYGADTRPVKPDNAKPADKPKGGWRTKSGVRRLGKSAVVDAKDLPEAAEKIGELLNALKPAARKNVVRLKIDADATDVSAGGNPFDQ